MASMWVIGGQEGTECVCEGVCVYVRGCACMRAGGGKGKGGDDVEVECGGGV